MTQPATFGAPNAELKNAVRDHWERETCGTRYGEHEERRAWFDDLARARYTLEPYIPDFADFPSAEGKDMLEIGVGAGVDFTNWCRYARRATGVDLTERAIELTGEHASLRGVPPEIVTLRQADAEKLPFPDNSFDLVYSWGVLHHTPDTPAAFREVLRVLKPGGRLKAMVYHVPSWTGLLLAVRYRRSQKRALFEHLESPGTKAYTLDEARALLTAAGYDDVRVGSKLGPSDLLTIRPSEKYRGALSRLVFQFYPRWLVRLFGDRFGLYLTIEARKPAGR